MDAHFAVIEETTNDRGNSCEGTGNHGHCSSYFLAFSEIVINLDLTELWDSEQKNVDNAPVKRTKHLFRDCIQQGVNERDYHLEIVEKVRVKSDHSKKTDFRLLFIDFEIRILPGPAFGCMQEHEDSDTYCSFRQSLIVYPTHSLYSLLACVSRAERLYGSQKRKCAITMRSVDLGNRWRDFSEPIDCSRLIITSRRTVA